MAPDSPLARVDQARRRRVDEDDGGADAKAAHAAVGGAGAELEDEDLSANVVNRKRYVAGRRRRRPGGLGRHGLRALPDQLGLPGLPRAPLVDRLARAGRQRSRVASSTQGTFYVRKQLAKIFGLPLAKVRVTGTPLGGAFGSKLLVVDPLVAGAALVLKRPVRLALNRREDMAATNPASGCVIESRIGARSDGTLSGIDARLVFDAGAYTEWTIEGIAAVLVAGPYRWEAFDVRAYGVRTNRFGTGSYRGPGGPQAPSRSSRSSTSWRTARHRSDRAPPAEPRRRGRRDGRRRAVAAPRSPRGARGRRRPSALAGPRRRCPGRRGRRRRDRRLAGRQGAGCRDLPAQRRTGRSRSRPASST